MRNHRFAVILVLILLIAPNLSPAFRSGDEKCCNCPTVPCCCQGACPLPGLGESDTPAEECALKDGCRPEIADLLPVVPFWGETFDEVLSLPESGIPAFTTIRSLRMNPIPPTPPPRPS